MIYLIVFWAIQAVAAGLMILAVRRPNVGRKGFLLLLSALPVALCIFWGVRFGVEPGTPGAGQESMIANAPICFFLGSVVIWIVLVVALRNARLIAALVDLLEVPTTFLVALLAVMQVTGSWI